MHEQPNRISPEALPGLVGRVLGVGPWFEISQARIDRFADDTNDRQWIHVDPDRAKDGPFGTTVAHGYLTLALLPTLTAGAYTIDGVRSRINYGLEKVRFPAVVPAGSRIRNRATLDSVEAMPGGLRIVVSNVVELERSDRPACVARSVTLLLI